MSELIERNNSLIEVQGRLIAETQRMFADEIAQGNVGGMAAYKAAVESSRHISAIVNEQQRLKLEMASVLDRETALRLARNYADALIDIFTHICAKHGLDADSILGEVGDELDNIDIDLLLEEHHEQQT